ncbi:MAG: CaiB/BaiF CoA transferase family protein [Candidatus Hodarchaeales archaeon]
MDYSNTLKNIRVLDLTDNLPGPFASQILGDFGADVIKIEPPGGDRVRHYPPFNGSESIMFLLLNRNKRSIVLNLKSKKGLEIFYKLVEKSDIILVSFKPETLRTLKIDFETVSNYNKKIIYCSITGYGSNDSRAGHDINYVASSGILDITGSKELPTPIGVPIGDIGGGSLPAVISILAALLQPRTEPKFLEIPIIDHLIPWLTIAASNLIAEIEEPKREDHVLSGFLPFYRLYRTKDAEFISFATLEFKFWKKFCHATDRLDLIDKQYDFDILKTELPKIFVQKTKHEWDEWFTTHDIPGAGVRTVKEALTDKIITLKDDELSTIKIIKSPFLDDEHIAAKPPRLGQDTIEILNELGSNINYRILKENSIIDYPD